MIALTWWKDETDLPRLAASLEGEPSLPYALYHAYGAAAIPYLEDALAKSGDLFMRANCARELVLAGRPSGFAFLADAIENDRSDKLEMIQFARDRFPELRNAGEAEVLEFVRSRAQNH